MIELSTVSPSSINKFVECQSQWCQAYDRDTKVHTSSKAADRGTLVHAALEIWKDPRNGHATSFEALEKCFAEACLSQNIGEDYEVYKTGRALLHQAHQMLVRHPVMPLNRTSTWMVEAKIDSWLPSAKHPLPILGYIDTLELIHSEVDPMSVILVVGDYKTGKGKTREELLEDIQPPVYMAYALYVLKPWLEAQGYTVTNVLNVWTYIAEESCIVLTQDDYDLPMILEYIANISSQMLKTANEYNTTSGDQRKQFLVKHEKLNAYCNWCPVRGTCTQVNRAFKVRNMIDLYTPGVSFDEILLERDMYALAAREGDERRKQIDRMVRTHLEQNNLDEIRSNGKIYYEVINHNKKTNPKAIVELFGVDFFLNNASLSQDALKQQLNVIKITKPDMYDDAVSFIQAYTSEEPGARYLRSKEAKQPKETKKREKNSTI